MCTYECVCVCVFLYTYVCIVYLFLLKKRNVSSFFVFQNFGVCTHPSVYVYTYVYINVVVCCSPFTFSFALSVFNSFQYNSFITTCVLTYVHLVMCAFSIKATTLPSRRNDIISYSLEFDESLALLFYNKCVCVYHFCCY